MKVKGKGTEESSRASFRNACPTSVNWTVKKAALGRKNLRL